ncbi:MAG: hypothetical protein WCP82_02175 [Alphaproteobacteria bacterium]
MADNVLMAPSSKTTETVLPDWYTNYAMDILSNQQAISNQPYTLYGAPRIAEMAPQQQQAFGLAGQAATAYQPGLAQATQTTQNVDPYLGLYAASPYYQQAGQTSASQVGQYMNPYTTNVVNRIGELGNRALQETILPNIRDKFIQGGTYGGSRNAELFGRGVRDSMENITAAQTQALASGYGGALTAAQNDLTRQGELGTNIASQYNTAGSQQLAQGSQLANLAGQQQGLGITGAGALQAAGSAQQGQAQKNLDLGYQDFLRQQAYPQQQNTALVGALQGVKTAVPSAVVSAGTEPATNETAYGKSDLENWLTGATTVTDFLATLKKQGII